MKRIISILFLLFSISLYGQDSLLLVEKRKLEFMMGRVAENTTLKKRIIEKDSIVVVYKQRIITKDSLIASLENENSYLGTKNQILVGQNSEQLEEFKILKKDYRKAKIQLIFLKVGITALVVVEIVVIAVIAA